MTDAEKLASEILRLSGGFTLNHYTPTDRANIVAVAEAAVAAARAEGMRVAASLAAAISLLERGGKAAKKAAASDKMFDQMLADYRKSLADFRAAYKAAKAAQ